MKGTAKWILFDATDSKVEYKAKISEPVSEFLENLLKELLSMTRTRIEDGITIKLPLHSL